MTFVVVRLDHFYDSSHYILVFDSLMSLFSLAIENMMMMMLTMHVFVDVDVEVVVVVVIAVVVVAVVVDNNDDIDNSHVSYHHKQSLQ